ncbi:MAG TPA: Holliday junction branch migration protein RuvA [Acidimicrobiales bacterium]|nr:Holliday junction branch migration protein RuvA [Acidimicrobiales bacterium]
MIGSLRGIVLDRLPPAELLLEVGGVGYRVTVTPAALAAGTPGQPLFVHVHTHVREDAIVLYGFPTADERRCFEALLGAHGVGPGLAVAILSALTPHALRRAVAAEDADALTAVPGVGRKTAARLLLELESRLDLPVDGAPAPGTVTGDAHAEVRAALAGLGYGPDEVRSALRALPEAGSVEELLTSALRQMAGAR